MLRLGKRLWRSRPVSVATLIGAAFGVVDVFVTEIAGVVRGGRGAVLPLFLSPIAAGSRVMQLSAMQTVFVLLVEVAANVLVFALLFAIPVALVVGIRRVFRRRESEPPDPAGSID